MATSGYKSAVVTPWDTLRFNWSQRSQSIDSNATTINWSLTLTAGSDGAINSSASKAWWVVINGTRYYGTNTVGIGNNSERTLASGTALIKHNDDGTKSFDYSFNQEFNINFNGWIGNIFGSGSGTLDTIPRASQPSCITWPEHTENVGSFGDEISVHMNRASAYFTHTVRYQFGSKSGTIATGVGTGTKWIIPKSLMNEIPKSTKGSGRVYVDTYNSAGTLVGTKYCTFTATVPNTADCSPTCNFTLEDVTGWDDTYSSPVQGLSKIKVTVNPILAYGSQIVSYVIGIDGNKYTTSTATTGLLKTAGSSPVTVIIKDQRGRSATTTYNMNVQPYVAPSISELTVHRCDLNGTENDQGDYISITFSAAVTALKGQNNTAAYTLRTKKSTDTEYTAMTLGSIAGFYTVSNCCTILPADTDSSYDVEIEVKDRHNTTTRATSASTAFTLINWGADGRSMAIGKVVEKDGVLQIGLDTEFFGKVSGTIFDAIYPVGSIYLAYNHTNPATLFGGTWVRMTDGFLWASRATDTIGQTGGEKTHKLTLAELPAHNHGGTYTNGGDAAKTHAWLASGGSAMAYEAVDAGDGQAHNNMPPYIQVSIWRRTA